MAKIARKTSKLFGSTAGGSDIGVFGSLAAGSPAYSTDPAVIQSLSNFLTGWAAETIATRRPAYQDFNALDFLTFYQLGYLFQAGVPEWDAGTNYFTGSICTAVGTGILYRSLTDNNLNNAVTDASKWETVVPTTFVPTGANALAGSVVQLVNYETGASATGSTPVVFDNTKPQSNEGDQFMSLSITPKAITNKLKIDVVLSVNPTGAGYFIVALFKDSGVDAIASMLGSYTGDIYNRGQQIKFTHFMDAGSVSALTFKVRAGTTGGGCAFNWGSYLDGTIASSITITEIKV